MNAIEVIYEVRRQPGVARSVLLEHFVTEAPRSVHATALALDSVLHQLQAVDIVTLRQAPSGIDDPAISLTAHWDQLYGALGVSLSQMRLLGQLGTLAVRPVFGTPSGIKACDVFVVMPFKPEMNEVYRQRIAMVVEAMGLTCLRADDIFSAGMVMNDTWSHIVHSRVVVADCTGRNPNVFYEIGIAHTIGKPVVLITQDADDVPFDVRHLRFVHYNSGSEAAEAFGRDLSNAIRASL